MGSGERLILNHAFRKFHSAEFTHAVLVVAPCAAGEIATDNHFEAQTFATIAYGDHRVGDRDFPVGNDVGGSVEERCCYLIEGLPLVGDAFWGRITSKAEMRSVATMTRRSSLMV